jgi:iron complex outermembrane receptor protein
MRRLPEVPIRPLRPVPRVTKLAAIALTLGSGFHAMAIDLDSAVLQEVIVTADKIPEPAQKLPSAVTVIDGDSLTFGGITDLRAVQDFVPSVRFQQENASTEIYIRGVGSTLDFPQLSSPNAFNLNGISIPREATSVPLYDVEQIEVLPGPQGTLYGSNALGGAVNVNFRRPTMDYETSTLLEAGNYSSFHVSAVQNLPLGDCVAARLAIDYLNHHGYMTSGADSQKDLGARLSLLYTPFEDLTVYLWGSSVSKDGHPPNLVIKGVNPLTGKSDPNSYLTSNPWNDQFPGLYAAELPDGQPMAERQSYFNRMAGSQVDLKLAGDVTLTWIPSYLSVATSPDYWLGAFPGNETNDYRQVSNELRAAATTSWGTWIAGAYAYDLDSHGVFTFGSFNPPAGIPVSIVNYSRIDGEAAFGQVSFNLSQRLRTTLGGRSSVDDRVGQGQFLGSAGLAPFTYGRNFSHLDHKVGLDFDLAPQALLYAATQTGYQPGTFNAYASTPTVSNGVNPATLTAYTAGIKSREWGNRLQVNDEVFYYDYRGLFSSAYNTVLNSNQTFNAQKTEIYGDQLDVVFRPDNDDRVTMSVGYLHARSIRFELPDGSANYDGFQLQYSPDWTVDAGYYHDLHWGAGFLRAQASSRYEDSFYADFSHTPGGRQQPYVKSDASLTYHAANDGWSVGLWVKNIENVAVIAATAGGSNIPPLATGATAFLEPPRTFGVRATSHF